MTGKTHIAVSAAAVAIALSTMRARASLDIPCVPASVVAAASGRAIKSDLYPCGAAAIAGLMLLGVVAGLFGT